MKQETLLSYYQKHNLNPVPIVLETPSTWKSHCAKRQNLYERHLGIPLSLLRGRSVLEIGCCSGENALVLASVGANLTLVEPNEQMVPLIQTQFKEFGFEERIVALLHEDIDSFRPEVLYDFVLAEGFLCTLPNRDEMIIKIGSLLNPGGMAVVSFNDRYGGFLEMTKRMLLWRACQIASIDDVHSEASLELARRIYGQDFAELNASRPFDIWWKDVLVNPFLVSKYFWSYPELLSLVEKAGCEFYSSSPKWTSIDNFRWYKDVLDRNSRNQFILNDWSRLFSFFLTGFYPLDCEIEPPTIGVVDSVSELLAQISKFTSNSNSHAIESVLYPSLLDQYFQKSKDPRLQNFGTEMRRVYNMIGSCKLENLLTLYRASKCVRNLWGTPYHYLCFSRQLFS